MSLFSPLAPISLTQPLRDPSALLGAADPKDNAPSFSQTLQNALETTNDLQIRAGEMTRAFATGQTGDIHSVMIAGEQATIALQMVTQVRNKVVDAYQQIMQTSM